MAGGPYYPASIVPVSSDNNFRWIHVGAGANGLQIEGMGVKASIASDAVWHLVTRMPSTLPSGSPKLILGAIANAATGNAKVNVKWNRGQAPIDLSDLTLSAEGVQTLSWGMGDEDKTLELETPLDAESIVASDWVVIQLTFETSGWTLAEISTWIGSIIFED